MQIDRILYPIKTLGPGNRMIIWTIGCCKSCEKCANPELRPFNPKKNITLEEFKKIISSYELSSIDGFTISGGEPLCQAEELSHWIDYFKTITDDILIFTGYTMEEIAELPKSASDCLKKVAVTVSGEYVDDLNDNYTPLIASTNQMMIWGNEKLKPKYNEYMKQGRKIQNVYYNNSLISVGIHNRRVEHL